MTADQLEMISTDPQVMHGQAVIAGTHIPVSVILDCLADGMTAEEITAEYPTVTLAGMRAADRGQVTEILTWLDDHSRYALSVTAHNRVTGPVVLAAFRAARALGYRAADRYLPRSRANPEKDPVPGYRIAGNP